ncbi:MAG: hypothetical protein PHS93_01955 [Candidatus Omnitrophica bacterium]|nr:hypothetical protein [Candidatus Omnitrophota bacterium]MDD5351917.1 hypothetical protein [Candidatus Omnitrophota bacterium]MDD5550743.1 hypothetical protein [Candidatus Omnitrophota bacterium]
MGNQKEGFFTVADKIGHTGKYVLRPCVARNINSIELFSEARNTTNTILPEEKNHNFSSKQSASGAIVIPKSHKVNQTWTKFNYAVINFVKRLRYLKSYSQLLERT